ncbi:MAG: hypothetical protein B1H06_06945 [Candidatus Cloacimonas sp. 4484_143]|nr:MAG: hypothetical protein B1H06_06945 [Candidatus Cloacimonas sp. 4484_143]RLC49332.1 MAG: hypothetical protein DRI23_09460 [Candidatus Cloacimonadota bacterium]RLC53579.1 MAG: hypothetical protein DRH79_03290 [Candidatus Cloacimonadota bacterium]
MRKIVIVTTLLLITGSLLSYSILESVSGNYIKNLDARSAAMGQTGVVSTGRLFDMFINPANLASAKSNTGFQLGMNFVNDTENRSLPMYNSFDAYSGEGTYVSNENVFADFSFAAYYKYEIMDFDLVAALSYRPQISFDANYFEEVRNNDNSNNNDFPPILANNYIESEGAVNAAAFSLAADYRDFINVGFEIAQLDGDAKWERKINWTDDAIDKLLMGPNPDSLVLENYYSKLKREFKGMQFKVGANITISPRIAAGFSFVPKVDFDVTGTLDSLDIEDAVYMYYSQPDSLGNAVAVDSTMYSEFITPARMKAGICFQPQNIMKTNFNCDVELVKWSEVNDLYDDEFNFFVGIEHVLKHSIPIRIGFSYETSYGLQNHNGFVFSDKITKPSFTAGTGFTLLDRFTVDIGLQYSYRKYEALDLFMDNYYWQDGDYEALWNVYYEGGVISSPIIQDRGWENPDTVKERFVNLKTSISFNW